jgi:serine/threonine protein kinase
MRTCDTCGGTIGEDHPYVVCAECLFAGALDADEESASDESSLASQNECLHGTAFRVSQRRDFFEKYEIQERLWLGGQGEIFKVWDFDLRRSIAMKRLAEVFASSSPAVHRFFAEAQTASKFGGHTGILPVYDVGVDPDGRPFYTTALLPGTTFEDVLRFVRDAALPEWSLHRALGLLRRVCEIMAYAHSRNIIHVDLKPDNLLVGEFGDVHVIDWGSANVLNAAKTAFEPSLVRLDEFVVESGQGEIGWSELDSSQNETKVLMSMTILFTPPEILRHELSLLGPRTDIYALGVMLYSLCGGRPPYSRSDGSMPPQPELERLIKEGPPAPIRTVKRSISRDLAAICEKAMARDLAERYGTTQELANEISAFLEFKPVQARRPGLAVKIQKWARRNSTPVLVGSTGLALVAITTAVALHFKSGQDLAKSEKNHAQQMTALGQADLAARSGQWRELLGHLREAEAAGYSDAIRLGLQRVEAWTVLSESALARAELEKMAKRSDLGRSQGIVLLRLGEHELFDKSTFERGVQHVRDALTAGLEPAEKAFAEGLLAESTSDAWEKFQETLRFYSYHHGARRHSLGLEFILARRVELESDLRIFRALYPDDPSPVFIEATQFALDGKLAESERLLERFRNTINPQSWSLLLSGLRFLASARDYFDLEVQLEDRKVEEPKPNQFIADATALFLAGNIPITAATNSNFRFPQLPCIKSGLEEGMLALKGLAFPMFGNAEESVEKLKSSWQRHPEALLPLFAATFREMKRPADTNALGAFLSGQAELYQLAANSRSVMSKVPRMARFLLAKTQFELVQSGDTRAREACLDNIRDAANAKETSVGELRARFDMAFALRDFDLARELLSKWELRGTRNSRTLESRIQLEMAVGNFGNALRLIEIILTANPTDDWALAQRKTAVGEIQRLAKLTQQEK